MSVEPDLGTKEQAGEDVSGAAVQVPQEVVPAISPKLPVPLPDEPSRRHLNWRIVLLLILVALGAAGGRNLLAGIFTAIIAAGHRLGQRPPRGR